MTNEECNALLTGGLTIEGLIAFRKKRNNEPDKISAKEWLDRKKSCLNCSRSGCCRKQNFGYAQHYADDVHINREFYAGHKSCCHFSGDTLEQLDAALQEAIEKGEVNKDGDEY